MKLCSYSVFLIAILAAIVVAVPVGAVLQEVTFKGSVTAIEPEGVIVINADSTYGCTYEGGVAKCMWTPIDPVVINGAVPDAAALSVISVGDMVEATSIGGFDGNLIAIGRLVTIKSGDLAATDLIGDPDTLPLPLIGDYKFSYITMPDPGCNSGVCPAVSANITLMSESLTVVEMALKPGESFLYNGRNDGSSVNMLFVSGEASGPVVPGQPIALGPQPVSKFVIHLEPPIGSLPETPATETLTPAPTSSGTIPTMVFIALGCIGLAGMVSRR